MRDRKWLGRDKVRCLILHEKGEKAEEKVNEFVLQSGLKRVVLIISYEVPPRFPLSPRCTAAPTQVLRRQRHHRQSAPVPLAAPRAAVRHAHPERHGGCSLLALSV